MIPPQAINYVGLALAKAAGWGFARLAIAGTQRVVDSEILRLSMLDEPALLMEIARADNAGVALDKPDDIIQIQYGQATVHRWLPKVRTLICPHRHRLLTMVDSPEVEIITTVVAYLVGGLPGALVKPLATLLVKRGISSLCGNSSLSAARIAR